MTTQEIAHRAAERAGRRRAGVLVGVLEPGGGRTFASHGRQTVSHEHSLFEIGSVTKVFTATVLADEVVRGNLSLDQPVRELLPDGVSVPTREGTEITLGHLATHTSGLPRTPKLGFGAYAEFFRGRDPYAPLTPTRLLELLGTTKLKRRPGTGASKYSNFGFGLLGAALVHHAGARDFHELVTERICSPLGLARTGVAVPGGQVLPGHRRTGKPADRWLLTGIAGAGALVSTADDLLTFLAAQLAPDRTPLAQAIRLTQEKRVSGRVSTGLGWMLNDRPMPLVWHNGGTGGYRSFVGFLPGRGTAVVALTNQARSVDATGMKVLLELNPPGGRRPRGSRAG